MPSKSVATKAPAYSVSDDEIGASDQENTRPPAPKINRTVVKKATTTKKPTTRPKVTRKVGKEPEPSDVEEPETTMEPAPKPKQRRKVLRKVPVVEEQVASEPEPAPVVPSAKSSKQTKPQLEKDKTKPKPKTKRAPSPEPTPIIIPETQPEPTEIDQSVVEDVMDIDKEPSPQPPPPPHPPRVTHHRQRSTSVQRQAAPSRARSTSRQPGSYSRGQSASDTERRVAESEANRRLADLTNKYEDLRIKYDALTELGPKAAEANFERLKKASDQKAKDANDLIASLKKELAEVRKTSSASTTESAKLQSTVAALTAENDKLKEDQKATHTSLTETQNETKALTAKLEAARKTNAASDKVPGSAVKKTDHAKTSHMGGATAEAVKENALKEELYRDLTGLIINSVKRRDGEDEYSCIQTGRNGTLHFHLTVATDNAITNPKTPSNLSYEDTEFAYEPLLDADRDRDLIDILPDYLTEEICFPRNHAVKFYTKVVESMTRRVVVDEE